MTLIVTGPSDFQQTKRRENFHDAIVINTTSRSSDYGRAFSPFLLGPVDLYRTDSGWTPFTAKNVENAWQYSKVYKEHLNSNGNPSAAWWRWALAGWKNPRAQRYPMGKGRIPEYSYWAGRHLNKIEARKEIYIPLYVQAVKKVPEFQQLKEDYEYAKYTGVDLILWDFDGYNHHANCLTYEGVINNIYRSMGHAFVLAMILEGIL